jgi:hypothetical protein
VAEARKEADAGAETVAAGAQPPDAPPSEAATLAPAGPPPSGDRPTVPGFEILEELGRGGMGVVYKARQVSLNRFVALKMILAGPYSGPDHLARFRREAEAVACLQHPGIVQIHEIGSHAGHSYLALEYVPGGALTTRCAGRPLPPMLAADLVHTLARAVHYAHQRGVVHRDLKPGNVLMTEDGSPKITDFGLAKRLDPDGRASEELTQSGAILGTPSYMAPEQASGKRGGIGPAVDVYALGAILYELLTGRPPFQADSTVDLIFKVVSEAPASPRKLNPTLPRDLETVCLKCLQKEPAQRYGSAEALADDLKRFRNGEPTLARPAGKVERFRRWAWRRRWRLAGGAAAALVLLLLSCSLALNFFGVFYLAVPVNRSSMAPAPVVEGIPLKPENQKIVLPDDLALVPRDATGFLTVRMADLWGRQDVKSLDKYLLQEKMANLAGLGDQVAPIPPRDWERVTYVNLQMPLVQSFVVIVRPFRPFRREALVAELERRGLKAQQLEGKQVFASGPKGQQLVYMPNDHIMVWSNREQSLRDWLKRLPAADAPGPLRPALDLAARGHHIVAAAAPSRDLRNQLVEELKNPPPGIPKDSGLKLPDAGPLAEVETAILKADLRPRGEADDKLEVEIRLVYTDPATAPKAHDTVLAMRDFLAGVMKLQSAGAIDAPGGPPPVIARELSVALRRARLKRQGVETRMTLEMDWPAEWLVTAATAVKEEGERRLSFNKLRRLAVGMWSYHDVYGNRFPPTAITDKAGKPLLSWRVAILPFIGEDGLHKQFKLDEPWDSDHNKKLLARMPADYAPPLKPKGWEPNTTFYQVFVGAQTLFPPGKPMGVANVTDGTSNTLMIVEAGEAVPWTRPADLPYNPKGVLPMLGGIFHDGFQAVMADGRTGRFLPKNIDPKKLRALITPAGGEKITLP